MYKETEQLIVSSVYSAVKQAIYERRERDMYLTCIIGTEETVHIASTVFKKCIKNNQSITTNIL